MSVIGLSIKLDDRVHSLASITSITQSLEEANIREKTMALAWKCSKFRLEERLASLEKRDDPLATVQVAPNQPERYTTCRCHRSALRDIKLPVQDEFLS